MSADLCTIGNAGGARECECRECHSTAKHEVILHRPHPERRRVCASHYAQITGAPQRSSTEVYMAAKTIPDGTMCHWLGCDRPATRNLLGGLCDRAAARVKILEREGYEPASGAEATAMWKKRGIRPYKRKPIAPPKPCMWPGCDTGRKARRTSGLCSLHHARWQKVGSPSDIASAAQLWADRAASLRRRRQQASLSLAPVLLPGGPEPELAMPAPLDLDEEREAAARRIRMQAEVLDALDRMPDDVTSIRVVYSTPAGDYVVDEAQAAAGHADTVQRAYVLRAARKAMCDARAELDALVYGGRGAAK